MKTIQHYRPAADLLQDRVILVTGATGGLGSAAARAFATHGATVVLLGRNRQRLEALYDEIEQAGHPRPALVPLNLESAAPAEYEALAQSLQQEFGRLDGLLHNAALLGTLTPIEHYNIRLWERVMQVNLHAPFLLTRACLPLLGRSSAASVVFTSDEVGRSGRAYWGAYGVSKFAIEGLMQTLAADLAGGSIRVNSLDPGPALTALRRDAYPAEETAALAHPQDLMPAYLYLMGPDSARYHGQAFTAHPS